MAGYAIAKQYQLRLGTHNNVVCCGSAKCNTFIRTNPTFTHSFQNVDHIINAFGFYIIMNRIFQTILDEISKSTRYGLCSQYYIYLIMSHLFNLNNVLIEYYQ